MGKPKREASFYTLLTGINEMKTWEIMAPIVQTKSLRNKLAQRFGIKANSDNFYDLTVYSWGRPPASDEFPNGTGRPNPIDHVLKIMDLANPYFPVEVQMIALVIGARASRLAKESGTESGEDAGNLILRVMRRALDVLELLKSDDVSDAEKRQLAQSWLELEIAFAQTKSEMQGLLNGFYRKADDQAR